MSRLLSEVISLIKGKSIEAPYWLARRHLRRWLLSNQHRVSGKLLDYGCGEKRYERYFLRVDEYIGLEVSDKCTGSMGQALPRVVYYDGSVIPFADKSFDSIVSFQVLEHVRDIDKSFKELIRVGKEDCTYMFTVPMFWPEHEIPNDFRRFTEFGIKSYLDYYGLELDEIVKTGNIYEVVALLLLDYLFTQKSRIFKILAIMFSPAVSALAVLAGMLDPGSRCPGRKCYLDICLVCRKKFHD